MSLCGRHWKVSFSLQDLKLSGIELQRQLVAGDCEVPTIFITAHEDEGVRAQALKGGAEAVLIKPFSEEALLNAVDTAVRA